LVDSPYRRFGWKIAAKGNRNEKKLTLSVLIGKATKRGEPILIKQGKIPAKKKKKTEKKQKGRNDCVPQITLGLANT